MMARKWGNTRQPTKVGLAKPRWISNELKRWSRLISPGLVVSTAQIPCIETQNKQQLHTMKFTAASMLLPFLPAALMLSASQDNPAIK